MKRQLEGVLTTLPGGRICYEVYAAVPDLMIPVAEMLKDLHGFPLPPPPFVGPDEVFTSTTHGGIVMHLAWDNWSGFYVHAGSPEGDALVRELAQKLEPLLPTPEFERYIHDF